MLLIQCLSLRRNKVALSQWNSETVEIGIVGEPANDLLGYEGVEGAVGPRFRKLSKEEIEDYLTNL